MTTTMQGKVNASNKAKQGNDAPIIMKQQPSIPPEAEFVQPKVLAPILGISSATLRRMALKGQVPYVKAGDCYLFPIKTILRDWHEQARKAMKP